MCGRDARALFRIRGRDGLQPLLERLHVEGGRPTRLGRDHRLEHPVLQRQPDPDGPAQRRGEIAVRGQAGIELDGHAVGVAATHGEGRVRGEGRDLGIHHRRAARHDLVDRQPGPDGERCRVPASSLDADDARRDEPLREPFDGDQGREDIARQATDPGRDRDVDGHQAAGAGASSSRRSGRGGTTARARAPRPSVP